ncbi:MAG: hypothetical protein JRN62_02820 [Nitrososphaerota archaeon]|jgi:hypothetical protein|nr:hypothetical protein [Nitrososphaerota archaeon]MDG6948927.1 hypothetical protein [Nitrososphaerota archaeon]
MSLSRQPVIVRAPAKLANKIAGRLHLYYDVTVKEPGGKVCQIDAVVGGTPTIVCMFEESLELGSIMTLFRLKARQLGISR